MLKTGGIPRIFWDFEVLRFWARLMQNGDQNQGPEAPKSTPEAPKSAPEAPKSTPEGSGAVLGGPGGSGPAGNQRPGSPKRVFWGPKWSKKTPKSTKNSQKFKKSLPERLREGET